MLQMKMKLAKAEKAGDTAHNQKVVAKLEKELVGKRCECCVMLPVTDLFLSADVMAARDAAVTLMREMTERVDKVAMKD